MGTAHTLFSLIISACGGPNSKFTVFKLGSKFTLPSRAQVCIDCLCLLVPNLPNSQLQSLKVARLKIVGSRCTRECEPRKTCRVCGNSFRCNALSVYMFIHICGAPVPRGSQIQPARISNQKFGFEKSQKNSIGTAATASTEDGKQRDDKQRTEGATHRLDSNTTEEAVPLRSGRDCEQR